MSTPPTAPDSPPPSRRAERTRTLQFAAAIELPFIFVAGIVIGGGAGYWIDARLGTSPLFLLVLGVLGFAAGLREILRRLSRDEQDNASR
jgi:ATP synthase protein I